MAQRNHGSAGGFVAEGLSFLALALAWRLPGEVGAPSALGWSLGAGKPELRERFVLAKVVRVLRTMQYANDLLAQSLGRAGNKARALSHSKGRCSNN